MAPFPSEVSMWDLITAIADAEGSSGDSVCPPVLQEAQSASRSCHSPAPGSYCQRVSYNVSFVVNSGMVRPADPRPLPGGRATPGRATLGSTEGGQEAEAWEEAG